MPTRCYSFVPTAVIEFKPLFKKGKVTAVTGDVMAGANGVTVIDFLLGQNAVTALGPAQLTAGLTGVQGAFASLAFQQDAAADLPNHQGKDNLNVPLDFDSVIFIIPTTGAPGGLDRVSVYIET